ncbi:MAG: hypothetical protein SGI74_00320 [Oligoflexia bacterium]|nr:hypothetical protein [Oligoflexia bacterium]
MVQNRKINPDAIETRLRRHLAVKTKSTSSKILAHFYSWQERHLQPVIVVENIGKIAGVQQLINDASRLHYFEPKLCYDNALTLTVSSLGGIEACYVEGFVVINGRRLVPHAWNSIGDRHFDYTRELVDNILIHLGKPLATWQYFKVIELPFRDLHPYTKSCKVPIQIPHFRRQNRLQPSNSKVLWRALRDGSEHLS